MVVVDREHRVQTDGAEQDRAVAPENTHTNVCQSRRGQRDDDKHHCETGNIKWYSFSLTTIQNVRKEGCDVRFLKLLPFRKAYEPPAQAAKRTAVREPIA